MNLVRLEPGHMLPAHTNHDVDVVIVVLAGAGTLVVGDRTSAIHSLVVAHVPRGVRRHVAAGPDGLVWVTVHVRRGPLTLGAARPRSSGERR